MFVRACRSATIRTRLDGKTVHERLSTLATNGYFLGGVVGPRDFDLDYRFNNRRNPQTYAVRGTLQETPDWRILRLKLTAHAPWVRRWELAALVLFLGFSVYGGEIPPARAVLSFAFVMAVYAGANLFYIPDVVTNRVSSLVASELQGSVLRRGEWVVPQ